MLDLRCGLGERGGGVFQGWSSLGLPRFDRADKCSSFTYSNVKSFIQNIESTHQQNVFMSLSIHSWPPMFYSNTPYDSRRNKNSTNNFLSVCE